MVTTDRKHEPEIKLSDNRQADLQDLDRLVRAYPEEALDILMTVRDMGGAMGIMNRCRRRVRKKIKENMPGVIHHTDSEGDEA